jgi:hypothetical protein
MMKNKLKLFGWICGAIAIVMMLVGIIAVFAGGIFMDHRWSNYFYPAYNFLLLGIFLFVAALVTKEKEN